MSVVEWAECGGISFLKHMGEGKMKTFNSKTCVMIKIRILRFVVLQLIYIYANK